MKCKIDNPHLVKNSKTYVFDVDTLKSKVRQ